MAQPPRPSDKEPVPTPTRHFCMRLAAGGVQVRPFSGAIDPPFCLYNAGAPAVDRTGGRDWRTRRLPGFPAAVVPLCSLYKRPVLFATLFGARGKPAMVIFRSP